MKQVEVYTDGACSGNPVSYTHLKKDEIHEVSDGYARNYLFPRKLAAVAAVSYPHLMCIRDSHCRGTDPRLGARRSGWARYRASPELTKRFGMVPRSLRHIQRKLY